MARKYSLPVVLAGVPILTAILVMLYLSAQARGRDHHCRNNLRHLGMLALSNRMLVGAETKGRAFWQEIRKVAYSDVTGEWRKIHPDPFVCPVLGTTVSDPEDPEKIDYLGPGKNLVQEGTPLGADRPGNHPHGGYVVLVDNTVKEYGVRVKVYKAMPPKDLSE